MVVWWHVFKIVVFCWFFFFFFVLFFSRGFFFFFFFFFFFSPEFQQLIGQIVFFLRGNICNLLSNNPFFSWPLRNNEHEWFVGRFYFVVEWTAGFPASLLRLWARNTEERFTSTVR
eukprot:TRINITY_DN66580_c0_g1_i1.p2 TRINITY_DN66580_c0_g1~~TRINITY_DN66580_c0_g1_i1.p2  ORF type:complete len:116 (-),score=31.99 TRINITY_DN66580_c0_g1_i1:168-515(-)